MNLVEVSLRNWRSYRNVTFRFPSPSQGKNVILVGAQNGVGKTSLLVGVYLGLFGREAMHLIEGVRLSGPDDERNHFYRGLLERMLHIPARGTADQHYIVEPVAKLRLKRGQI